MGGILGKLKSWGVGPEIKCRISDMSSGLRPGGAVAFASSRATCANPPGLLGCRGHSPSGEAQNREFVQGSFDVAQTCREQLLAQSEVGRTAAACDPLALVRAGTVVGTSFHGAQDLRSNASCFCRCDDQALPLFQ